MTAPVGAVTPVGMGEAVRMWHDGWGGAHWVWVGLVIATFWTLVITGIVLASRPPARRDEGGPEVVPSPKPARSALDVLDERYARGELTDEQYVRRRDVLSAR